MGLHLWVGVGGIINMLFLTINLRLSSIARTVRGLRSIEWVPRVASPKYELWMVWPLRRSWMIQDWAAVIERLYHGGQ